MALCFCLLASACATPQADRLLQTANHGASQQKQLDVPFVAQTDDSCGPAALAMVLQDMGRPGNPAVLTPQTLVPGLGGSLQAEMLATGRRQGLLSYRLSPDMRAIVQELDQGRPVITLVNLAFNWWPRWHYAVITGYDLGRGHFIVHSADTPALVWDMRIFERLWRRGGHWSFVLLEPGHWPADPDRNTYIKATLDLENSSGLEVAGPAWLAAATRWPDDLLALIGAGNTAYGRKELVQAEGLYRRALTSHPASATAANNLAQVLHELGRREEAMQWALKAVDLGGGLAAQQTLDSVRAASAPRE